MTDSTLETGLAALTQAQVRTQQQIDFNARSIQSWEAVIEQLNARKKQQRYYSGKQKCHTLKAQQRSGV